MDSAILVIFINQMSGIKYALFISRINLNHERPELDRDAQ